jgi:hypothetical protein
MAMVILLPYLLVIPAPALVIPAQSLLPRKRGAGIQGIHPAAPLIPWTPAFARVTYSPAPVIPAPALVHTGGSGNPVAGATATRFLLQRKHRQKHPTHKERAADRKGPAPTMGRGSQRVQPDNDRKHGQDQDQKAQVGT